MKRIYIVLAAITAIALSGCKDHTVKEQTLPTGAIDFTYEVINDSVYNLDFYAGCTVRFYPTVTLKTPCTWEISDGREFEGDELICDFPVAGNFTVTARANNGVKRNPIMIADIRPIVRLIQEDSICTVDASYISFDVELPNPQKLEAVYKWSFPGVKNEQGETLTTYEGENPGRVQFTKAGSQPVKLQVVLGGRDLDPVTRNVQVALDEQAPTLYYAVKEGNIMARKLTSSTKAQPYNMGISSGQHAFNLIYAADALYILDAGKQFNYVNDENGVMGDGKIQVMAKDASSIGVVMSNVGGPAFQDPFYAYADGDMLYYSDRNTGIFRIPLSSRNLVYNSSDFSYWVQNATLGYYSRGLAYGAITGGIVKIGDVWYWSKTFNGQGIWRFRESDILPNASAYSDPSVKKPEDGEFMTAFYPKAMAYDKVNQKLYVSLYDMAAGVYALPQSLLDDKETLQKIQSAGDLANYKLPGTFEPIVEAGKGEGSSGEFMGICQIAVDDATGDVYFGYRSSDPAETGLYRYNAATNQVSLINDTKGVQIYGVAINQTPSYLF